MRVLHILWTAHFGGIEKVVLDLATEQSRVPGMEVAILFGNAKGEFLQKFRNAGLDCYSADLRTGFDFAPWKLRKISTVLKKFDVLHMHTFVLPLAFGLLNSSCPVVYTEHGNFGLGRKLRLADRIKRPLYRLFLKYRVARLTFTSAFTEQLWNQCCRSVCVDRSVVPNGIALNEQDERSARVSTGLESLLDDNFVIGTSCRFAGFKRVDRLLKGFAMFHQGRKTKLLLVGDGMLRPQLEELANNLKIRDSTVFAGFRSDVRMCQQLMDVSVFPSQNEPFGLVAVETLALGKPTVVFADGGGIADIVRPVCAADVVHGEKQLADRLSYYYQHRDEVAGLQKQRIEHARKHDIRVTAAAFNEIYHTLTSC